MTDYALYVESGPKHRKTMVHVLALLGCVQTGPTTEEAVAATPDAIRDFRRLLQTLGEPVDLREDVETHVALHVTEGYGWLGNGDPHIAWEGELGPTSSEELETWVSRFTGMRHRLADWSAGLDLAALGLTGDERSRRANGAILQHILAPTGSYLSAVLGPCPGYNRLATRAERGELHISEALHESAELLAAHILAATPEQREVVVHREQDDRTLRKQMRHVLEHEWEHYAELARRPGGPAFA